MGTSILLKILISGQNLLLSVVSADRPKSAVQTAAEAKHCDLSQFA